MLNQMVAGLSAFSLAFCVYSAANAGGGHGGEAHATVPVSAAVDSCCATKLVKAPAAGAAGDSCCPTEAVSAGPEACTHCESEAKREADGQVLLMSAAGKAPATGPAVTGEEVKNTKCIVTAEEIGSMGEGKPVSYKGKVYKVCCSGCVAPFNKEPEKYVKALEADPAKFGVKK